MKNNNNFVKKIYMVFSFIIQNDGSKSRFFWMKGELNIPFL